MVDRLPLALQTVFADLVDRLAVDELEAAFPFGGSFVRRTVKARDYWYFVPSRVGPDGKRAQRYVGPDTAELRQRIEQHGRAKTAWRERRQMVSALKQAGLPSPDERTGEILAALAAAGVFRLRTCLVGSIAFQCYAGILGVRLPGALLRTSDLDLAQFHDVSVAIAEDDRTQPLIEILRTIDPTFREVPYVFDGRRTAAYVGEGGYRVEILVPSRGAERDAPQPLPAIGAMGQPLRFLDFLIFDAIPSALLHEGGVLVQVPRPERYALHKLIVSRRRREGAAKIDKDLAQAETLLRILADRRKADLRDAWVELQRRGPRWRELSHEGLEQIDSTVRERVLALA